MLYYCVSAVIIQRYSNMGYVFVNKVLQFENSEEICEYTVPEKCGCNGIYNKVFKRCIDFVFALAAGIILFPIVLIVSVVIVLESGFPVFYTPERGGYKDKPFKIFKFRTMVKNADKIGGGTTALNDPRITKIGNILRKTKFDEIPQIYNVLLGNMSFVGPRPELLKYTGQYNGNEKLIFKVRPGITDFSSIEFINLDEIVGEGNADEMYEKYVLEKKNNLRVKYACEVSFKTDVMLFVKTVVNVLKKAVGFITTQEGEKDGVHKS